MGYIVKERIVTIPRNNRGFLRFILPKNKKVYVSDLSVEEAVTYLVGGYITCNDIYNHQNKEDIFDLYDQYLVEMGKTKCIRRPLYSPPRGVLA